MRRSIELLNSYLTEQERYRAGRVAPRCRWQIKRGISVCSGRRGTKAFVPRTFAGHRKRAGQKRQPPKERA